jgi:hypothetical protein
MFFCTDPGHRCEVSALFCSRISLGIMQKHGRNKYGVPNGTKLSIFPIVLTGNFGDFTGKQAALLTKIPLS